jgi:hypothetical protein
VPYVIDVANWATDDGAIVHLWNWRTDSDYRNQLWTAETVDAGSWRFVNAYSGKCLARGDDDSTLFQYACNGDAHQLWTLGPDGEIQSTVDGRCVEIDGHQRLLGAAVLMAACDNGWYQHWNAVQRSES